MYNNILVKAISWLCTYVYCNHRCCVWIFLLDLTGTHRGLKNNFFWPISWITSQLIILPLRVSLAMLFMDFLPSTWYSRKIIVWWIIFIAAAMFANSKWLLLECCCVTPVCGTELVCQRGPGLTSRIDFYLTF